MPEAKPHSPSILQIVAIAFGITAVMIFFIIAMNTGDLMWFIPTFEGTPTEMVVYCYGTHVQIKPGNPAFEAINTALNESLSGFKRWDQLSMSDITLEEYRTSPVMLVLEAIYDPPVTIHSSYKFFKMLDGIIIPLDGRHASTHAVFGRLRGYTAAGSYHVNSLDLVVSALAEQGICAKP